MTTYLFALLVWMEPSALYPLQPQSHLSFLGLVFFMTALLPGLNIVFFKLFGAITSLSLYERRERILPSIVIAVLYTVITYMLYSRLRFGLDDNIIRVFLVIDALVMASVIATLFYKVSVHCLSLWGLTAVLLALGKGMTGGSVEIIAGIIIIDGFVMSSRLELRAHTLAEVLTGSALGFVIGYFGIVVVL